MTQEEAISEIIDITSSNMTYPQMIGAIKEVLEDIVDEDEDTDYLG